MRASGVPFIQGKNSNGTSTKYAVAIHNTSNPGANADAEASYAQRRPDGVGSHFYADAVKVIQSNDTDRRVGHAGSSNGNSYAIAVEITGANAWTRQQWLDRVDWAELGAVLAQVCRAHGIPVERRTVAQMQANPRVRGFYSHDDMRRAWGGTTHTDPGPGFPWDRLLGAVQAAMGGTPASTGDDDMTPEQAATLARVDARLAVILYGMDDNPYGQGQMKGEPNQLKAQIAKLAADVAGLHGTPIEGEVLEGGPIELSETDVERIAKRVDELLAARLAS